MVDHIDSSAVVMLFIAIFPILCHSFVVLQNDSFCLISIGVPCFIAAGSLVKIEI